MSSRDPSVAIRMYAPCRVWETTCVNAVGSHAGEPQVRGGARASDTAAGARVRKRMPRGQSCRPPCRNKFFQDEQNGARAVQMTSKYRSACPKARGSKHFVWTLSIHGSDDVGERAVSRT